MIHLAALIIGFAMDLLIGDPEGYPHFVVGIGKLVTGLEKPLRRLLPDTRRGQLIGGGILVLTVCAFSAGVTGGLLYLCGRIHGMLRLFAESYLCWQCIALRSLKKESAAVQRKLEQEDLAGARIAVGRIVGRDTDRLDEAGVARAAVETVAENASDGVVAPLLYLMLGGAVLGVLYKAINTMDSMLGYQNERYRYFGRIAARLDDVANFVPARLCAWFGILCAPLVGLNGRGARSIYRRDRRNHKSPNAAHPESVFAGALGLRLGGESYYFGERVAKPSIGDEGRPIKPADIARANRLLYAISFAVIFALSVLKGVILWFI